MGDWANVSSRPGWPALGRHVQLKDFAFECSSGGITRRPSFCRLFVLRLFLSLTECRGLHSPNTTRCRSCASQIFERREVVIGRWSWHPSGGGALFAVLHIFMLPRSSYPATSRAVRFGVAFGEFGCLSSPRCECGWILRFRARFGGLPASRPSQPLISSYWWGVGC